MMVFSSLFSKSGCSTQPKRWAACLRGERPWARCFGALLLWLAVSWAQAAQLEFQSFEIVPADAHYQINAALSIAPNARLEELVNVGVALTFVAELEVYQRRWYWLDKDVVERTMELRLAYHSLTRQYRVSHAGQQRSFSNYEEALRNLLTLRNWVVLDKNRLSPGESYNVALRVRLDPASVPKPFQVAALGSRDLDISSGWTRWVFLANVR